jgi:hypothetical protein
MVCSSPASKLSFSVHRLEFTMSPINRALIPALALSGVLLSLSPMAQAGPPLWAAAYGNSQGNYGSRRDHGDRRVESVRRDERRGDYYQGRYDQRDYRDRRAPRVYNYARRNDYWHYGNDYRNGRRNYPYQGYRNYGGNDWRGNYGMVRNDRCNTDGVLTVMGAVTGGIIGNRSASHGNRDVSTVVGAIAGGILGNAIGSSIDGGDRACNGYWSSR